MHGRYATSWAEGFLVIRGLAFTQFSKVVSMSSALKTRRPASAARCRKRLSSASASESVPSKMHCTWASSAALKTAWAFVNSFRVELAAQLDGRVGETRVAVEAPVTREGHDACDTGLVDDRRCGPAWPSCLAP